MHRSRRRQGRQHLADLPHRRRAQRMRRHAHLGLRIAQRLQRLDHTQHIPASVLKALLLRFQRLSPKPE
jgi:hypothetical protein